MAEKIKPNGGYFDQPSTHHTILFLLQPISLFLSSTAKQAPARRANAAKGGGGGGADATRATGEGNDILQFYTDDSPGLQVGPTTVLVASLSFVGVVVLLHIWGKFRMN